MIERRLTVLVGENGTVEILPSRSDQTAGHRWLSIILLSISFLIGSFLCLTALLGLIFTSKTHRPSCLQWLTLAALLDCVQGHMFGATFVTTRPADSSSPEHRHLWCSLSAALSLSLLLAQAGYLAALSVQVKSEPRKSFYKACCSVLPLLVSMAVAVEAFCRSPVNYFPHRNGCGFVNTSWTTTVWHPHTLLTLTTLAASCLITTYGLLGQQLALSSKNRYQTDKTVLKTLTVLFVFLVMPYGALMITTSLFKNTTSDAGSQFGFKSYETFLTWIRYQFNNFLPIVVLVCYKEVRKEGKSLLMFWFRKNNAVHGCSETSDGQMSRKLYSSRKRRSKNCEVNRRTNPETPVLFATTRGLYLRTVQNTQNSRSVCDSDNFTDVEKTILCEPCDFSEFDSSRVPSRCQSFCSSVSGSRLQSRANVTPDLTKESAVSESAARRRNVVRFSEEVIELPAAAESGVWSDPDEIAKRSRDEMGTTIVKSSLGSTYTKLK